MTEEGVKYRINLEDFFSKGIKDAENHASNFEKRVDSIGEHLNHMKNELLVAFGIGFSIEKIVEFGKESVDAFEKIQHAKTQLDNALANRNIGITTQELVDQAEEYSKKWIFSKEQIMSAQLALTNFKNLHGEIYERTEKTAINIASKRGGDLGDITNTLGRALNDPNHAARMLRQFGVVFSDSQTKMLKSLQETGQIAKAQDMIFKQLNATYKGSADAAAATAEGQKLILSHSFEEVKESFGKTIDEIELALLPTFASLTRGLQKFADWTSEHSEDIANVFIGIKDAIKDLFGMDIKGSQLEKSFGWIDTTLKAIHSTFKAIKDFSEFMGMAISHGGTVQQINALVDAMHAQERLKKAADEAQKDSEKLKKESLGKNKALSGKESTDLGSDINEPKASKIQNVTINVGGITNKVTAENVEGALSDIGPKISEFLISLVQDAAIVSTE